ncbi:MAG: OsmC family protein [Candidatus Hydrogenedentota bacterium]
MSVIIDVAYRGDLQCRATHGPSQSKLVTDAPVDNGGMGSAFSPTDLVATALGSCLLTIMGKVAQRRGLDIRGARVRVTKAMVSEPVRHIGSLTAAIVLPAGARLDAAERKRLENGAMACPVKRSLHPDVEVRVTFEYPETA